MGDSKKTIRFSKKTIRFRNDNDGNVYSRSGVSSDPVNRRAAVQIVHDRRFVSTVRACLFKLRVALPWTLLLLIFGGPTR